MNTQAAQKPTLKVRAGHIGPIMSLDGKLSDNKQNLIFARNGTGKSFLARALRLLDENALEGVEAEDIPELLVSEEATSGQGTFGLYEDSICIGGLGLNRTGKQVTFTTPKYIFHVFSEDYVNLHLRQKEFEFDGEITHEIIVGKENLTLDAKETEKTSKQTALGKNREKLDQEFASQKQKLQSDFQINAALGSFRSLSTDVYFEQAPFAQGELEKALSALLADYNKFKTLPSDPRLPVGPVPDGLGVDFGEISDALSRVTSPSSVADDVKKKIAEDPDFFRSGLELKTQHEDTCPFCTQTLAEAANHAISKYQEYFVDAEAKEKDVLAALLSSIDVAQGKVESWRTQHLKAKTEFDELKAFFPSVQTKVVEDLGPDLDALEETLVSMREALKEKQKNLALPPALQIQNFADNFDKLVKKGERNGQLYAEITNLVGNSRSERLGLQNAACGAFLKEFATSKDSDVTTIRQSKQEIRDLENAISELRRTQGDKADARTRVSETFTLLLKRFFGEKYTFDPDTFKVLREKKSMARGGDRTLSDGEKSVMAFCYFLAQSHLKVASNEDYARLYFVFDDPVTSMSFDYVYAIVQTLKLLRISAAGEVDFNPKSGNPRPRMLVLTHNNYFYNVASSNNAIPKSGLFQLVPGAAQHTLASQKGFATPHQQQLKHVFDVSEGRSAPDFMTPNSIRSVVESMWKFCRPDLNDFGKFYEFLIDECEIELKSVLINDLSHGGKFDDPPHKAEDIVEASREAILVVERFAQGQLKHL